MSSGSLGDEISAMHSPNPPAFVVHIFPQRLIPIGSPKTSTIVPIFIRFFCLLSPKPADKVEFDS
jgi:hypothetical protein